MEAVGGEGFAGGWRVGRRPVVWWWGRRWVEPGWRDDAAEAVEESQRAGFRVALDGELAHVQRPVMVRALCRPAGYADRCWVGGVIPEIGVGLVGIILAV